MARTEQGKRQSGTYRAGEKTEWHVQSRERDRLARIEQGKRQSGTYRAGKETKTNTEWHV